MAKFPVPSEFVLLTTFSYVVGAIPFAAVVSKFKKVDLTKVGSGNYGATNVYRAMGLPYALLVFFLDAAKAGLMTYFATLLFESPIIHLVIAFSAILGHTFSLFLGFKGGKGVACAAGVFAILTPIPFAITMAITLLIIFITRMVSVGSMVGAVLLPFLVYYFQFQPIIFYFVSTISFFIVFTHRANIMRLIQGKENKV